MKMCINCLLMIEDSHSQCPHCGYTEGINPVHYCHLPPRTVLMNRYILGRPLGSGGFGVTYIAWDTTLERRVAIKEYMPGEMTQRPIGTCYVNVNQSALEVFRRGKQSFLDESMRLARLGDIPGVVRIFDCFEANGTAYIVMEFLEGETLLSRIERQKQLSCEECVPIILSVLDALERIHAAAMIHRDIAPDNIMLCNDGRVVLIDFGAARHVTTRHSRSLSSILKVGYAPPEQYDRMGNQGPWTDVYAVGATMYHALTGEIPPDAYTRATGDTMEKPSKYARIPNDIQVAILNAMNVTVERRTQTAAQLASQLRGEERAVRVRENTDREKFNVSGRTKVLLGASVAAVLVVALLLCFGIPKLIVPRTVAKVPEGMSRVPSVQTMNVDEADSVLSDSDLRLRITERVHDDFFEQDIVLYQNPAAGSVAYIGSMVDVKVSAPEATVPVPDVSGFDGAAAQTALTDAGFVVVTREEYSDTAAPGSVLFQSIGSGESVKPGTVIELVISRGPENSTLDTTVEVTAPQITGMTFEQAQQLLIAQGVYVSIGSTQYSDTIPAGQIISQSPAEGTTLHQGDTVSVVVSAGKQTAIVPDVRYLGEAAARQMITASNLVPVVNYEESESVSAGLVIRQDKTARTGLNPGDTVTIWVSTGYQVTVPNCVGRTQADAVGMLSAARLSYAFTSQNSTTVPEGQIISQSVTAGSSVEQGTTVTLTVSAGNRTVAVTGVTLSPGRLTLGIGDSSTLVAAVKPADATTASVTWTSSNPGVAQVSAGGTVTALSAGTATITVTTTDGAKTASCTVTVTKTLSSVTVVSQPSRTVYYLGDSFDRSGLSVRAGYNDGSTADVTGKCTLSGFDSSSAGTKTVTVSYSEGGVTRSGSFQVSVSAPDLIIAPASASMIVGDTEMIMYTLIPSNGKLSYSSSNSSVAKVSSDGVITAVGKGSATITVTVSYNGYSAAKTCQVTVSEKAVDTSMYRYSLSNGSVVITGYTGTETDLTIPSRIDGYTVTGIDYAAFSDCENLTLITIPDSVTSIDEEAFFDCKSVTTYNVSSGNSKYKSINGVIFSKDGKVLVTCPKGWTGSYVIPDGVASIGNQAFSFCDKLTSITIPNSVTHIGDTAFKYCNKLTSITLSNGVASMGEVCFYECKSLTSINVSNGNQTYKSINGVVFSKDGKILISCPQGLSGSYVIPDGVTGIGDFALYSCDGLTSITIPDGVTDIGDYALFSCNRATTINIPDSVTSIGEAAFWNCASLVSVNIPNGVTNIGAQCFAFCTELKAITIPESMTSIGDLAFYSCNDLTSITIPSSVRDISSSGLYDCEALKEITISCGTNTTLPSLGFSNFGNLTKITILDGITEIGSYVFENCKNLRNVTIPDSVTEINSFAFNGCTSLDNITIPGSVKRIYNYAFKGCTSLTALIIENGVDSIGNEAFMYTLISELEIPESVRIIGDHAFSGTPNLTRVKLHEGVKGIQDSAFSQCSIIYVAIPNSVTNFGSGIFDGCNFLSTIYCNEGSAAYDYAVANGYSTAPYDQYPG